jgi:hypothetical protein
MSRLLAVLLAVVVTGVVVPSASAKEGVKATLTSGIPLGAQPGQPLPVSWTLTFQQSGKRYWFGASGVFVRLGSRLGAASTVGVSTSDNGRYSATVVVPEGGIGDIQIGLRGQPSEALFPIVNDPLPGRATIATRLTADVPGGDSWTWVVAPLAIGAVALGAGILSRRRSSGVSTSPTPLGGGRTYRGRVSGRERG